MNRDYNAAINIRRNLLHFIDNGDWHPRFSKKKKEEESQQEPASASASAAVAVTVTTTTATTTSTYNSTATTPMKRGPFLASAKLGLGQLLKD